jgi:hypothetical protein
MKFFTLIVILNTYLCFIQSVAAQVGEDFFFQKGVEVSWCNDTIVFYNRKIKGDEQIEAKLVAFNIKSGQSFTFPHNHRLISSLAFNDFIVSVTLDGQITGFTKTGELIQNLMHKSRGEGYLSACKLSDDGTFVVLTLLPTGHKKIKTYVLDFIKINNDNFFEFKRLIPKTSIGYGKLVYYLERLWLLEKDKATQIDFSEISF